MSYESFTLEKDGHVANMTLCRGESFNTMTKKFWIELPEILNEINRDPDLRSVVISSTGKHFCAGMDLANFDNGVENISPEKKPDHARVGEVMYRVAKELQGYITNIETIRAP
ncbi:MAG: enoyl-CoA hydratase-related protein, partial [Candidatus Actinomarina sp.]